MSEPAIDLVGGGDPVDHDTSREDILRQIFGDIGELIDDFSCAVESKVLLHGRMYITNRFICFYSNLFGLEKKIRIPYSHIKSITKENTAMVIPNAIAISTDRKDYCFRSFWDREDCFRILSAFLAKYRGAGADLVKDKKGNLEKIVASSHSVDDTGSHRSDRSLSKAGFTLKGPMSSKDDFVDTESGERSDPVAVAGESGGDMTSAFDQEKIKLRQKIPVVTDTIDISLKDFAKLFVEEEAPYNYQRYHESVKDTNLVTGAWTGFEGSNLELTREIKFFKPVNLPGLASTRGVKLQRYLKFEDVGLIVASSTRLEDVPAADTFSVEDVIAVKSIENGTKVEVEISFQVQFIKSTYLKYMIERSTNSEMAKWLEAFFSNLKKLSAQFKEGKLDLTPYKGTVAATPSVEAITATVEPLKAENEPTAVVTKKATGAMAYIPFVNESLGDQIKLFLFAVLVVFLIFNYFRWSIVTKKLDLLERQLHQMQLLAKALLDEKMKAGTLLDTLINEGNEVEVDFAAEISSLQE